MNIFIKKIMMIAGVWAFFTWLIGTIIGFLINLLLFYPFDLILFLIKMPGAFLIAFGIWFVIFYFYYKMLILINLREWYKDE